MIDTMTDAMKLSLDAMFDPKIPEQRRAEYEAAGARQARNVCDMTEAEAAVEEAGARRAELLAAAAKGEHVAPDRSTAAELACRDAESRVAFLRDLDAAIATEIRRSHDALALAHHDASAAIADHGVKLYVSATKRWEAASKELADAEAAVRLAAATIHHAANRGYRLQGHVGPKRDRGFGERLILTLAEVHIQLHNAGLAAG